MGVKHLGNVVCAVIEKGESFLIAERPKSAVLPNLWEFPGGKVEEGETFSEAINREIFEELQVEILVESDPWIHYHVYEDFSINLIAFRAKVIRGSIVAVEHSALAWVNSSTVTEFNLAEADKSILEMYLNQKGIG